MTKIKSGNYTISFHNVLACTEMWKMMEHLSVSVESTLYLTLVQVFFILIKTSELSLKMGRVNGALGAVL